MNTILTDIDVIEIDRSFYYDLKIHFSELDKTLLAITNILYSKKSEVVFYDFNKKISVIIEKNECNKILKFTNKIYFTENDLECIVSMLLDYLNGNAFMYQHIDFEFNDIKPLSGISISVNMD